MNVVNAADLPEGIAYRICTSFPIEDDPYSSIKSLSVLACTCKVFRITSKLAIVDASKQMPPPPHCPLTMHTSKHCGRNDVWFSTEFKGANADWGDVAEVAHATGESIDSRSWHHALEVAVRALGVKASFYDSSQWLKDVLKMRLPPSSCQLPLNVALAFSKARFELAYPSRICHEANP